MLIKPEDYLNPVLELLVLFIYFFANWNLVQGRKRKK